MFVNQGHNFGVVRSKQANVAADRLQLLPLGARRQQFAERSAIPTQGQRLTRLEAVNDFLHLLFRLLHGILVGLRYDTHGEQFHTKMVIVTRGDSVTVMGGSANLTRRNIDDYNLEADLRFVMPAGTRLAQDVGDYFTRIFTNEGGEYTLPFEAYRDDGWIKRFIYRIQELTGLSSF